MAFFKMSSDVESLDELGVTYEEPPPSATAPPHRRRRQRTDGRHADSGGAVPLTPHRRSAPSPPSRDADATDLTTGGSSGLPLMGRDASSVVMLAGDEERESGPSSSSQFSARGRHRGRAAAYSSAGAAWEASSETATTDNVTDPSSQMALRAATELIWVAPTGSSSTANEFGSGDRIGSGSGGGTHSHAHDVLENEGGAVAVTDGHPRTAGAGSVACVHARDNSLGFTFSGHLTDVVRFRSCIPPTMTRSRGGRGGTEGAAAPEQTGPFPADILNVILLFVDVSSVGDILEVSRVCRFWRHYANYAPHWTYLRRKGWSSKEERLAHYIRAIVAKPKIMTREEFFTEKRRVKEYERRDRIMDRVKHVRWCLATAIMAGVMMTANFVVAYILGFLRTALRSDAKLGATTAVMMTVMTLLEVVVVMIPLGGVSTPSSKDGMIRILCWGLVILDVGLVLGTITALAFTRVQANGHVLDGPTMDFSMNAECAVYPSNRYPSFVLLPAFLWDIRWRPITTDPLREVLAPHCLKRPNDEKNETTQCFVLVYFDAEYRSDVFHSKSMLDKFRNVGNTTALGFEPFALTKRIQSQWCQALNVPQVVALTELMYATVARERDANYPNDQDWLDPARRPQTYGEISYRCSSDINREATEDPAESSKLWFRHSPAWRQHYVPLVTPLRQLRATFKETHDHFLHYAFACYIAAACLWGVQLLGQCVVKKAAIDILGVTAAATLLLFNPLSLVLSGMLCVFVDSRDFMCDNGSGFGLIGGGVGLLLLAATIFVIVYD